MSKEEVQTIMQDVSERNRTYQPLTERDDTMMQRVVSYYKKHGTSNELMEAYYLLGSVYRDLHEAPKAMEAFLEGINAADTTAEDCQYNILARLYGQKCDLLYQQSLHRQAMEEEKNVYKYAIKANDTLMMVASQWERLGKCFVLGDYQTIADESWTVLEESQRLGQYQRAAHKLCTSVLADIELGRLEDARRFLVIYEQSSSDVDLKTYESRFPIYYYAKGRLLAAQGKLDSAEVFFRRELKETDWNNRQAAYRGLRNVFEQTGRKDSAVKYARLQCDAVDSAYQEMLSTNIQDLHELYDYNRAQNDSHQKTMQLEKEHQRMVRVRWVLAFVIMISLFLFYYIRARYEKRIARAELELEKAANEHEEAEYRLLELQKKLGLANSDEERAELEKEMQQAEEESALQRKRVLDRQEYLDELRRGVRLTKKNLRQRQFDEPLFRTLLRKSKEGQNATEQDYADMVTFLQKKDVGLVDRFYAAAPMATDMEFKVFLLMRMGMTKAEIATLTSHESNSISMVMNRFFKKVNKRNPESSAEADRWLLEI